MNRITYIELAGKKYPLSFSLGAAKAIAAKYGDLGKLDEAITIEKLDEETIDIISYTIAALMKQGAAYKNQFEIDLPPEPGAHIEDGRYIALSQEEIEMCIGIKSEKMITAIMDAIDASSDKELEADSKNEKASKVG